MCLDADALISLEAEPLGDGMRHKLGTYVDEFGHIDTKLLEITFHPWSGARGKALLKLTIFRRLKHQT